MTTSTEHKLLQAVKEDAAKELEAEAKDLLGDILTETRKREGWIQRRKEQLTSLGKITDGICKAYDNGDSEGLAALKQEFQTLKNEKVSHPRESGSVTGRAIHRSHADPYVF